MATLLYPTELEPRIFTTLGRALISGDWSEAAPRLAKDGWGVQGFLQRQALGDPDDGVLPVGASAPSAEMTKEELGNAFLALGQEGQGAQEGQVPTVGKIDWKSLFQNFVTHVLPIILPLILQDETAA